MLLKSPTRVNSTETIKTMCHIIVYFLEIKNQFGVPSLYFFFFLDEILDEI